MMTTILSLLVALNLGGVLLAVVLVLLKREPAAPAVAHPVTAPPEPPAPSRVPWPVEEQEVTEETLFVAGINPYLRKTTGAPTKFVLAAKGSTTIGRDSGNTIVLADDSASLKHCRVDRDGDRYYIVDLGSTNKTWLNGAPVERALLKNKDEIKVGETTMVFALFGDRS